MLKTYFKQNDLSVEKIIIDGKIHRCHDLTKKRRNKDGWYAVHQKSEGVLLILGSKLRNFQEKYVIHDGQTDEITAHVPTTPAYTPSPTPTIRWHEKWLDARTGANLLPYVRKKKINAERAGLKCWYHNRQYPQTLVTPVYNSLNDALTGLHLINEQVRWFDKGTKATGGCYPLGNIEKHDQVFLFEGISDAISVFTAFNENCYCVNCFSISNVQNVLENLKTRFPNKNFVVCPDNDKEGVKQGNNAAYKHQAKIATPPQAGDWNDYFVKHGPEATARALQKAITNPVKFVRHDNIRKANDDELVSVISNRAKIIRNTSFPTRLQKHKEKALSLLIKHHNNSPHFNECEDIISNIESSKLPEIKKELENYLTLSGKCDNVGYVSTQDLINGKYLPAWFTDWMARADGECFCVQSPLGSGKTELIKNLIERLDNQSNNQASILCLTPRRFLSKASAKRLEIADYEVVKNIHEQKAFDNAVRRMACTINSLPNLVGEGFHYDVVVIDEIELLISHILGNTVKNKEGLLDCLFSLIKNTRLVVCLDAFLGANSIELLKKAGRTNITGIVNENKPWQNVKVTWFDNPLLQDALFQSMLNNVNNGIPIAVATNSRKQSEVIHQALKKKVNKGIVVNRRTSNELEQQNLVKDPKVVNDYDLVIYTPTMEAGVSFDTPKMKKVYGWFEPMQDGVGTPLACLQQMGRFRQANEWYIYCPNKEFDLPTSVNAIKREVATRFEIARQANPNDDKFDFKNGIDLGTVKVKDVKTAELYAMNKRWENIQKAHFTWTLYSLIEMMGCDIHAYKTGENTNEGKQSKELGHENRLIENIQGLLNAPRFEDDNEYNEFRNRQNLNSQDQYRVDRYLTEKAFCLEITPDNAKTLVLAYENRVIGMVKNLEAALMPTPLINYLAQANAHGWNEDGKNRKSEIDSTHGLPLKAHILNGALRIAGIKHFGEYQQGGTLYGEFDGDRLYPSTKIQPCVNRGDNSQVLDYEKKLAESASDIRYCSTQVLFNNETIMKDIWYHFCLKNQKLINTAKIGITIGDDFSHNPMRTLVAILQQCGILVKSSQPRLNINQEEERLKNNMDLAQTSTPTSYIEVERSVPDVYMRPHNTDIHSVIEEWEKSFDGKLDKIANKLNRLMPSLYEKRMTLVKVKVGAVQKGYYLVNLTQKTDLKVNWGCILGGSKAVYFGSNQDDVAEILESLGFKAPVDYRPRNYQIDWERSIVEGFTVADLLNLTAERDRRGNWVWKEVKRVADYRLERELEQREQDDIILAQKRELGLMIGEEPIPQSQSWMVQYVLDHLSSMSRAKLSVFYYAQEFGMDVFELIKILNPFIDGGKLLWEAGGWQDTGFVSLP